MHAFARARRRRGTTVAASILAVLATALSTATAVLPASTAQAAGSVAAAAATGPATGPIDPNTGYPFWYADGTGTKYELCFDRAATTPGMCLAALQNPSARPWTDQDPTLSNLAADPEAFWYDAAADVSQGGVRARFIAAQEATFGGPATTATAGEQIAFGRMRVRLDGMVPGASYTVTQPYGTDTYVADDGGQVFVTQDIGCLDVPCDFTKPNTSALTSYLRWDPAVGPTAPAGYVGDPNVPHQILAGPAGSAIFRVVGPNAGGPGVNTIETDLFNVQGKLWNPTQPMLGLNSTHNQVDFGTTALGSTAAVPAQTVTLTNAGGGATPLQLQTLTVSGADSTQFTLSNDTCSGKALAPGATCTVNVSYTPAATAGAVTAQLNVPSTNGKDAAGGQRILLGGRVSDGTGKDARVTGPIDPANGFPQWYQDENGTRVALCDDQNDPLCVLPTAPDGTYDPAQPMSFPGNFPGELFWWKADSSFDTTSASGRAVSARLVLGEEATFLNGDAAPGDQIAFGRIRIRVSGLQLGGTYQVTTPYGNYTFVAEDDGTGGGKINYTEDIGCLGTPCDFNRVNQSNIGPFLRQEGAPAGYLGDPNVEAPVTGGPNGNRFVISGPGLDAQTAQTNLFAVSGKDVTPPAGASHLTVASTGTTAVSATAPASVTLTNDGTATATPQVSLQPATSGFAVTNPCQQIPAGGSCTVTIGLGGAAPGQTANLTVTNGTQTPITVPLQAAAASTGASHLTVASTGTTAVSATAPASVTLTNDGTATATPQVSLQPATSGFAVTNPCQQIPAGGSCTVTIGLGGAAPGQTANLTVTNGTQTPITVPLQAAAASTGTSKLTASSTTVTVKPGKPGKVTLTNVGTASAAPRVSLPASSGFSMVSNGCAGTLAPSASCTVAVGLDGKAPAKPGAKSVLQVSDGTTPVLTVDVKRPGSAKKPGKKG